MRMPALALPLFLVACSASDPSVGRSDPSVGSSGSALDRDPRPSYVLWRAGGCKFEGPSFQTNHGWKVEPVFASAPTKVNKHFCRYTWTAASRDPNALFPVDSDFTPLLLSTQEVCALRQPGLSDLARLDRQPPVRVGYKPPAASSPGNSTPRWCCYPGSYTGSCLERVDPTSPHGGGGGGGCDSCGRVEFDPRSMRRIAWVVYPHEPMDLRVHLYSHDTNEPFAQIQLPNADAFWVELPSNASIAADTMINLGF